MTNSDIFDRALRAKRRDRMMARFAEHDFFYRMMLDELLDRLADVQRELKEVLVIGCPDGSARAALEAMGKSVVCVDPGFAAARAGGGVQADEDALPFADDSFDLVIACGTLDSVNDLPGALAAFECHLISERLRQANGSRALAAQSLGIPKRTLARRCQRWNIFQEDSAP